MCAVAWLFCARTLVLIERCLRLEEHMKQRWQAIDPAVATSAMPKQ